MIFAQGVLVEEDWMEISVLIFVTISTIPLFCFVFVHDHFVIKIKVKKNLFVVLFKQVWVNTSRFKNAKGITKSIFKINIGNTTSLPTKLDLRLRGKISRISFCNEKPIDILSKWLKFEIRLLPSVH